MQAIDIPRSGLSKGLRQTVSRLVRDTRIIRFLKKLYDGKCQLCGRRLEIAKGRFYSEGHHLVPLGKPHHGDDVMENVVVVCPNCHVSLDYALVQLRPATFKVIKHNISPTSLKYHNSKCRVK